MRRRHGRAVSVSWLVLATLVACSQPEVSVPEQPDEPSREPKQQVLTVFAAASLREAFGAIAEAFEHMHPGLEVTLSFAGSQELRAQIEHGAAADVVASADQHQMDALLRAGRVVAPVTFAANEPVIVVARDDVGSEASVQSLEDLPRASRIVLGAPEVPIGRYTQALLERAGARFGGDFRARVEAKVVSRELNVRQVLAKVSLGEAQAGIVYRTDAKSAADAVQVVAIADELNVVAEYPIAVVRGALQGRLANAFVRLVVSAEGGRLLREAGFTSPQAEAP
jgi:molybdate transport system substrate-binding protein